MSRARRAALGALLGLAGCLARPPELERRPPRVTAEVLERFRLGADALPDEPAGLAILGRLPEVRPQAVGPNGGGAEADDGASPVRISIEDVIRSVEAHFPLILAALEEIEIAAGQVQSAEGAFDTKLSSKQKYALEDYYENERIDVGFEQPTTLYGATFLGGYRVGRGDFAVYDEAAETNESGEVRLGVLVPLLQGGRIDPARVSLWQARIALESAEPKVLEKRLGATRKAVGTYWRWVAEGAKLRIAERLLRLAEDRAEQIQTAVDEGQLARINVTDNRRLIVERSANLARAERGFQQAAIALSLFLRDADGRPLVPDRAAAPEAFPEPRDPAEIVLSEDVAIALARRPELRAIELERASLELGRELAQNQRLANLDVGVTASQDLGPAAGSPDTEGPFELEARVRFELPLQRRTARGKERELTARLAQLEYELRYAQDLVRTEVQDAVSALVQSWVRVNQASENADLAGQLEEAERLQLQLGESDLFRVNVREQQTAFAASSLVETLAEYFRALAEYRAVLGLPYDEVVAGARIGTADRPARGG